MESMVRGETVISSRFEEEYATDLHLAVKENDVPHIRKLIEDGAELDARDKFGRTPLHWALVYGHLEAARVLILNTDKVALEDSRDNCGCSVLHYAALGGRTEMGRIFIDRGAQVNSLDSKRRTPLHFAAQHPMPTMVEMLISRGADKSCKDCRGYLPSDVALEWANFSCLPCLRLDHSQKKDLKLEVVHSVNPKDRFDGGGRTRIEELDNEMRGEKKAELEAAGKAFVKLRRKLEEWRVAAGKDARIQRQSGEEGENTCTLGSSPIPSSSSDQDDVQNSFPPREECLTDRALSSSSSSSSFPLESNSCHGRLFTPLDTSNKRNMRGDGFNETLRWCTEWEVEIPHRYRAEVHLSHESTIPRETKGKRGSFLKEEEPQPSWIQNEYLSIASVGYISDTKQQLEEIEVGVSALSTMISSCIMKEILNDGGPVDVPHLPAEGKADALALQALQQEINGMLIAELA
ncbi:hypothetical protein R1flu_027203 [Riccia fluitans]|uniref:Ankyrin repeat protein n=1 Tax=Riccia fluitans TaxID=41844 RepID=A0ABD1XI50_9MARC